MKIFFSGLRLLCLAVLSVPVINGCTAIAIMDETGFGIIQSQDAGMQERNFAAADYLIGRARSYVKRYDVIKAVPLVDAQEPTIPAFIGKKIPDEIMSRFSQLGYLTDASTVVTSADLKYYAHADQTDKPDFLLTGTYRRLTSDLEIDLRLVETKTGRIIASYTYKIPLTKEISTMAQPATRIFKTSQ